MRTMVIGIIWWCAWGSVGWLLGYSFSLIFPPDEYPTVSMFGFGFISGFMLWLCLRNESVRAERIFVVHGIYKLCQIDIQQGHDPSWRWAAFEADVGYISMWLQFWKPVGSFYKNVAYLKPLQFDAPAPAEKNGCRCRPNSNEGCENV